MDSDIKKEQAVVKEGSQRKVKRESELSLKEERGSEKKEVRGSKRTVIGNAETENRTEARVQPRDLCKEELRRTTMSNNDNV